MNAIALDAMGGDNMPAAAVDGALEAARDGVEVRLVGDEARLRKLLAERGGDLPVLHAGDVIAMDDAASEVRRRRDASVMVAARAVREGEAAALVSMGHSGATMAAALFVLGRLDGIDRPAILANIPTHGGFAGLLDAGANTDARPRHLQQFAVLGSVYARHVFGRAEPKVGLISIGEEAGKGTDLVREAHELLTRTPGIRFEGNAEGRDLFRGELDVFVTDGFTGNVMLKLAEGEASALFGWIREALGRDLRSRLGGLMARPALKALAKELDPGTYGAQPLLGVRQPAFIGHGSSDARTVANALRFARTAVRADLGPRLAEAAGELKASEAAPNPGST